MPSLSPTMTEGTIVKWVKKEGETVNAGDVVCEIQTDKAVVSMDVDDDITVAKIFHHENSGTIPVGTLIAIAAEDGEDWKEVAANASNISSSSSSPSEQTVSTETNNAQPSGGSTPGTEIKMPSLSPTMTEGTIVEWKIKEGEKINAGDVLCEIQTDKAVVAMEVDDDTILAKIMVPEGTTGIQVGSLIALTVDEDQDWKDVQIPAISSQSSSPDPVEIKEETAPSTSAVSEPVHIEFTPNVGPATNLLMAQYGIKPEKITSTGPKGIMKSDVLDFINLHKLKPLDMSAPLIEKQEKEQPFQPSPSIPSSPVVTKPRSGYTDIPLSSMRTVIAKRLTESKQTSPHGHSTVTCNLNNISLLRQDFIAAGVKVSLNDFIIKAVGTSLSYIPEMNLNVNKDDDFKIMPNVDISVAVATDSGLITPIVKDVENKSIQEISDAIKDLAGRARQGKLTLDEFQGGTFTVSNLGMFGISEFTAIINPPQVGILAVGTGSLEIDPFTRRPFTAMNATLSFDRRFVDEALAADFMATFKRVLEKPEYMNIGRTPIVRASKAQNI